MAGARQALGSSKCKFRQFVRIAVAATLCTVVCGMVVTFLLIHLTPESFGPQVTFVSQVENQGSCYPETYTGDACKDSLQMYQQCLGEGSNSSEVHVPLTKDQLKIAEEQVLSAIGAIASVNPSQKCMEASGPFICFYYIGLCGSNGQLHLPSSEQCEIIRDDTCAREFEGIGIFFEVQSQCHLLPNMTVNAECSGNVTGMLQVTSNDTSSNLTMFELTCNKGFYWDESTGACLPQCGEWKFYPDNVERAINSTVIVSAAVAVTVATIGLVLSCIRYKEIFKFPSVIVVYETLSVLLYEIVLLIGRTDPTALFCSSKDLGESISNLTPYCMLSDMKSSAMDVEKVQIKRNDCFVGRTHMPRVNEAIFVLCTRSIAGHVMRLKNRFLNSPKYHACEDDILGAVISYATFQIGIWWFIHVAVAFWAVYFPFHYRSFQTTGKSKYLHLFTVLIGILLPLVPLGIAIGTGGYTPAYRIPPLTCSASNADASFYSLTLLIVILYGAGSILLVFIFLQLFKEHLMKDSKQKRMVARAKVLLNICYFTGVITYLLIILAINKHQFAVDWYGQVLKAYFLCESGGVRPGMICDRRDIDQVLPYQLLFDTLYILIALFPVVNLVYVVNFRELMQGCKNNRQARSSKSTYFYSN